jgi:hypothetical protein
MEHTTRFTCGSTTNHMHMKTRNMQSWRSSSDSSVCYDIPGGKIWHYQCSTYSTQNSGRSWSHEANVCALTLLYKPTKVYYHYCHHCCLNRSTVVHRQSWTTYFPFNKWHLEGNKAFQKLRISQQAYELYFKIKGRYPTIRPLCCRYGYQ